MNEPVTEEASDKELNTAALVQPRWNFAPAGGPNYLPQLLLAVPTLPTAA